MDTLLKYLKLYTVNEVLLNFNLTLKFDVDKRYVLVVIENNLTMLFINYKFTITNSYDSYTFNYKYHYYNFTINKFNNKKVFVLELVDDFNYTYLTDLLSTHFNKENSENTNNTNNIYINLQCYRIHNRKYIPSDNTYYLKSIDSKYAYNN